MLFGSSWPKVIQPGDCHGTEVEISDHFDLRPSEVYTVLPGVRLGELNTASLVAEPLQLKLTELKDSPPDQRQTWDPAPSAARILRDEPSDVEWVEMRRGAQRNTNGASWSSCLCLVLTRDRSWQFRSFVWTGIRVSKRNHLCIGARQRPIGSSCVIPTACVSGLTLTVRRLQKNDVPNSATQTLCCQNLETESEPFYRFHSTSNLRNAEGIG